MAGIRETRKRLQRTVVHIAKCEKSFTAFKELALLKQTVDAQLDLLRNSVCKEIQDASNTKEEQAEAIEEAEKRGYS